MKSDLLAAVRYGDVTIEACAARLTLALEAIELSQSDLAAAVGFQNSSITNMVKARQFPSRDVMIHLYFEHGVDFNYIFVGEIASLSHRNIEKFYTAIQSRKDKMESEGAVK